ncbi:MAG: hypothetical protein GY731_16005 [Gammaproteobacteria bacterium]|nr:hypothetical protein [Gammaproteobacteria bacterium]
MYGLSVDFVEWALTQRMQKFHEATPSYDLLQQHCQYAQHRLNVIYFPNYVAANFLNPEFNYDTPLFWGLTGIAQESGYRKSTTPGVERSESPGVVESTTSEQHTPGDLSDNRGLVWQRILTRLERGINRPSFNTWLRPTRLLEAGPAVWRIGVPDEVFVYWLGEYYRSVVRDAIDRETGCAPALEFVVCQTA